MEGKLIKSEYHSYILEDNNGNLVGSISDNGSIYKLSLKNCKAIENGYDLNELNRNYANEDSDVTNDFGKGHREGCYIGYLAGFQKALEILGDKKFSEFLDKEKELGISDIKTIERIQWYYKTYFDKSQQTEWDVEIEMWFHGTRHKKGEWIPKLDAEGCLILKRK